MLKILIILICSILIHANNAFAQQTNSIKHQIKKHLNLGLENINNFNTRKNVIQILLANNATTTATKLEANFKLIKQRSDEEAYAHLRIAAEIADRNNLPEKAIISQIVATIKSNMNPDQEQDGRIRANQIKEEEATEHLISP